MNLESSLDCVGVADLVLLLAHAGKTGALQVHPAGGTDGVVYLVDGAVTAASSDVGRQLLARRLVGAGLATSDHLTAAVGDTPPGTSLVPALRRHAGLADEQMAAVGFELALDSLAEMLGWGDGGCSFLPGPTDPDETGLSLPATGLLADARSRADTRTRLAGMHLDREQVLAPVFVVRPVTLTPGEWQLFALVDGVRTAAQVVALSGRGAPGVGALAELVARGLVGPAACAGTDDGPVDDLFAARERSSTRSVLRPDGEGRRPAFPVRVPAGAGRRAGLLDDQPAPVLQLDPAVDEALLSRLLAGVRGL